MGGEDGGTIPKGKQVSFRGDENCLHLTVVMVVQLGEHITHH